MCSVRVRYEYECRGVIRVVGKDDGRVTRKRKGAEAESGVDSTAGVLG